MVGKCKVCKRENVEVHEIETVQDEFIYCCDDCWNDDSTWNVTKQDNEVIVVVENKSVRLNTRVSADTNAWLDKKSEEMAISKSALVAMAVENWRKESTTIETLPALLAKLEELGVKL